MRTWRIVLATSLTLGLLFISSSQATFAQLTRFELDEDLRDYVPASGIVGGKLESVGSETMSNVMSFWVAEFRKIYSSVEGSVDAKGSNNAFPALIAGQANIGMMSRAPTRLEISEFRNRYGYEPFVVPAAIDMLAIWVHKDNPVNELSFEELDAIFSSTRKLGARMRARVWGHFTEVESYSVQPIVCFGRNTVSGTYGFFKHKVLAQGDYGPWVNELNGSAIVTRSIGADSGGIGYSGIGFRNASVKPLAISTSRSVKAYEPTYENAYNGQYPLTRFLYLVVNHDPKDYLDDVQTEFMRFVFSRQGQEQVVRDGYVPLSAEMSERVLKLIAERSKAKAVGVGAGGR